MSVGISATERLMYSYWTDAGMDEDRESPILHVSFAGIRGRLTTTVTTRGYA